MDLYSGPDSEYSELSESTAAQQIINNCNIDEDLKKRALKDISRMQGDTSYSDLLDYRNDEELGTAFNWFQSSLGPDFWQLVFNQLNGI